MFDLILFIFTFVLVCCAYLCFIKYINNINENLKILEIKQGVLYELHIKNRNLINKIITSLNNQKYDSEIENEINRINNLIDNFEEIDKTRFVM